MRPLYLAFMSLCAACSIAVAAGDTYLTDVIKNPSYSRALTNLLKNSLNLPSWTKQVFNPLGHYVGSPAIYATVDGTKYELFFTCKPHDCSDDKLEVMFSPNAAQAWGAIVVNGKPIAYLGAPSPAQQSALKAALE